jgi:hypothetical protein
MNKHTINLPTLARAWGSETFHSVLKAEIEALGEDKLPLQQGLSQSSYVSNSGYRIMPISEQESDGMLKAHVGVMYRGIIAGCSCADDPTPVDEINEYCEILVTTDLRSGVTTFSLFQG